MEWIHRDPFLIIGGVASGVIAILLARKHKALRFPLLFALCMLWFLMRGGLVINFYILPLLPFLALIMGMVLEICLAWLAKCMVRLMLARNTTLVYSGGLVMILVGITLSSSLAQGSNELYTRDETTPMREAINWVKQTVDPSSIIIVDNAIFVDLREDRFPGDPTFKRAEWFWKVEKDETVYKQAIRSDWLNVDYVLLSHEMIRQISDSQITLTKAMLPHTTLVRGWAGGGAHIDLANYVSTNGDWMRVYKLDTKEDFVLRSLWHSDKELHIVSYGQVVGPSGETSAKLQGQAMLRAIQAGDKTGFDGLWSWTRDHLQHRGLDKLISIAWGKSNGAEQVLDYEAKLESNQ